MNLSIKARLYVLAVVPILVIAFTMMFFISSALNDFSSSQIVEAKESMMQTKETELKSYIEIADSALTQLKSQNATKEQVIEALKYIKFGENGYLFGYDSKGTRVLLGTSGSGVGKNFWDLKDTNNFLLVQDIVKQAKNGGGYTTYYFPKPGEKEASPKLSYSIYEPQWDLIIGTGFYLDDVNDALSAMERNTQQKVRNSVTSIALISLVTVIIATAFAIFVNQSIIRPLRKFDNSIASFASGDADLTARMESYRVPEFAVLSSNFNAFVASLQAIIKSVSDVSSDVLKETNGMSSRAIQVNELIAKEKSETEQVATAMTELTSTANEISNNASQAADAAKNAEDNTVEAMDVFMSAVQSVQLLAVDVKEASSVISKLEINVQDISSSLSVIQDIAEQTNLLALNAAIEAARAGEQGRGFAVVADEVRKLASRTQASTLEIQDVIKQLKSGSDAAVRAMETSQSRSVETVEKGDAAKVALDKIQTSINVIMDMNTLIATATEEQSQVGSEISERVEVIYEQSTKTAELASHNREGGERLSDKAHDLATLVHRFTV